MPIPDPFTMAGGRQYADWPDLVTCPPLGVGKVIALSTQIDPLGGQSGCPVNTELLILAPDSSQQTAHTGTGFSVSPYFLSRLVPAGAQQSPVWRRLEAGQAASVYLGGCLQSGESAVRTSVGTSPPFISHHPGCPDLRVRAHQTPDVSSNSQLFWGPCPVSASGQSLAPLPASLSVPGHHASPRREISARWGCE